MRRAVAVVFSQASRSPPPEVKRRHVDDDAAARMDCCPGKWSGIARDAKVIRASAS
jgi:hypothetical protein